MSLILDALRKIERERKAKRPEGVDIRSEVLSYHGNPQPPAKSRLLPVIVLTLLVVTAAGAIAIYRGGITAVPVGESTTGADANIAAIAVPATEPRLPTPEPLPVRQKTVPAPPQSPPAAPQMGAPPRLAVVQEDGDNNNITISGIAWQDERSLRRTVINGSLVGEGAEISGARVVEIRENRVRFSREGQLFEVTYSSAPNR